MGFPHSVGLFSQFLSAGRVGGDGSTLSSQEGAEHGCRKGSDGGRHALSSPVHHPLSFHHDGGSGGMQADSHPQGRMLSAHLSPWRQIRLDKVSQGIGLFRSLSSYVSAYLVPGSMQT